MSKLTKKAIRDSFIKLLNEKPFNQITIRDIVDDCGVNRNTFYYYYQDLPQLMETIVDEDADRIIREFPSLSSLEDCLEAAVGFALENRKAVLHIFRSINRDIYEKYQWRACRHTVGIYMDGVMSGRRVSEEDRKLLVDYFSCVCFGFIIGWLETGMQDGIQERFHRLCELKQGEIERMISRCENE